MPSLTENIRPGPVNAALPSVAVASNGTIDVLYDTFDGISHATGTCENASKNPITGPLPTFMAHFGSSTDRGKTFSDQPLLMFLSPCPDIGSVGKDAGQRVLSDYQQLKALGLTFYDLKPQFDTNVRIAVNVSPARSLSYGGISASSIGNQDEMEAEDRCAYRRIAV